MYLCPGSLHYNKKKVLNNVYSIITFLKSCQNRFCFIYAHFSLRSIMVGRRSTRVLKQCLPSNTTFPESCRNYVCLVFVFRFSEQLWRKRRENGCPTIQFSRRLTDYCLCMSKLQVLSFILLSVYTGSDITPIYSRKIYCWTGIFSVSET